MDEKDYSAILHQLNFRRLAWPALLVLLVDIALWWVAFSLLDGSWGGYVVSQLLIGILCYHGFLLVHEAGHGLVFRSPLFNSVLGHLASLYALMPHFCWKFTHEEHHLWVNHIERDPGYRKIVFNLRHRTPLVGIYLFAWLTWIPLLCLGQIVSQWLYPISEYRQNGFSKKFYLAMGSVLFLSTAYTALIVYFGVKSLLAILPGIFFCFFLTELSNFPNHFGMEIQDMSRPQPFHQAHHFTRSSLYPSWVSYTLLMNFNYHTEHHYYPALPWFRLPKASILIRTKLKEAYVSTPFFSWSFANRRKPFPVVVLGGEVSEPYFETPLASSRRR